MSAALRPTAFSARRRYVGFTRGMALDGDRRDLSVLFMDDGARRQIAESRGGGGGAARRQLAIGSGHEARWLRKVYGCWRGRCSWICLNGKNDNFARSSPRMLRWSSPDSGCGGWIARICSPEGNAAWGWGAGGDRGQPETAAAQEDCSPRRSRSRNRFGSRWRSCRPATRPIPD